MGHTPRLFDHDIVLAMELRYKVAREKLEELRKENAELLEACKNARLGLVTLEQKSGAAWEVARMLSAACAKAEGREDA